MYKFSLVTVGILMITGSLAAAEDAPPPLTQSQVGEMARVEQYLSLSLSAAGSFNPRMIQVSPCIPPTDDLISQLFSAMTARLNEEVRSGRCIVKSSADDSTYGLIGTGCSVTYTKAIDYTRASSWHYKVNNPDYASLTGIVADDGTGTNSTVPSSSSGYDTITGQVAETVKLSTIGAVQRTYSWTQSVDSNDVTHDKSSLRDQFPGFLGVLNNEGTQNVNGSNPVTLVNTLNGVPITPAEAGLFRQHMLCPATR